MYRIHHRRSSKSYLELHIISMMRSNIDKNNESSEMSPLVFRYDPVCDMIHTERIGVNMNHLSRIALCFSRWTFIFYGLVRRLSRVHVCWRHLATSFVVLSCRMIDRTVIRSERMMQLN
jgi:hypothetical protein